MASDEAELAVRQVIDRWREDRGPAFFPDDYDSLIETIATLLRTPAPPNLAAEVRARTDAFTERQVDHALNAFDPNELGLAGVGPSNVPMPAAPPPAPADGWRPTQAMYDAGAQALFDDVYGGSSGLDDMLADVCRDNAKLAIDAALAASPSPPAPPGWRPIDFMAVKQCSECSSQLCATAHGMTGVIVVFDNREAAEAYQRAMLAANALAGDAP